MRSYTYSVNGEGAVVLEFPLLRRQGVVAIETTRLGGVSQGTYRSCNVGLSSGDDPGRVVENRRRVLAGLGLARKRLIVGQQVHGDRVAEVDRSQPSPLAATDGLWSRDPEVVLGVFVADCIPVFFVAPDLHAVGVVHSGWRGTLSGIALRLVEQLQQAGQDPARLYAAVGAGAGDCYAVGEDVLQPLRKAYPFTERYVRDGRFLDLMALNRAILVEVAGIPAERVAAAPLCSICHPALFFSYRRDGPASGRMLAAITWKTVSETEGTSLPLANDQRGCFG